MTETAREFEKSELPAAELPEGRRKWLQTVYRLGNRFHRAVALFLYTLLSLALTNPLIFNLTTSSIGPAADGDNLWYVWSMWWFKRAVLSGQDPAHSPFIFGLLPSDKPAQIFVDAYFNHALGLPMQWLVSPLAAYNILVLLSFILSGWTMYLLAGEFVSSRVARFSAGFFYTFSTFHFAHSAGHLGLATLQWLPFLAWRAFVFFRLTTLKNALWLGLAIALVPLSEIYYFAYFLVPFGLLFAAYKFIFERKWFFNRRNLALAGLSLVVAVLVAGLPLSGYLKVDPDVQSTAKAVSKSSVEILSADLLALVLPNSGNPLFGKITEPVYSKMKSPYPVEEGVFLGYVIMGLALAAFLFKRNRRRPALFWLILGGAGFVLALGPKLYLGGQPLFDLPAYDAVFNWPLLSTFRAPNRLVVLPLISLALLASFSIDALFSLSRFRKNWLSRGVLGAGVILLLGFSLAEHSMWALPYPSAPIKVPAVYQRIMEDTGDFKVLDLPLYPAGRFQYYQTFYQRPMVGGYAPRVTGRMVNSYEAVPYLSVFDLGNSPLTGRPEVAQGDIFPVAGFKQGLQDNKIKYVVFQRVGEPAVYKWMESFLRENLGDPFSSDEITTAWKIDPPLSPYPDTDRLKLGSGWISGLSIYKGYLLRQVEQDGQILIHAPADETRSLSFKANASLITPINLEVVLNGKVLKRVRFDQGGFQTIDLGPVELKAGENVLALHSVENCKTPAEIDPQSPDLRCFSFGVQQVKLTG